MIKLPPDKVLNDAHATAIVKLKDNIYSSDFRGGMIYLEAGTQGWTDMVWYDDEKENKCGWITGYMAHPPMGSGMVRLHWMSGGVAHFIYVNVKDLKLIRKLKAWGSILKYGCPTM